MRTRPFGRQGGAAAVEFALVVMVYILLVLGIVAFGMALHGWSAAVEASRRGARAAAIYSMGDRTEVLADMRRVFPQVKDGRVTVEYSADGTFPGTCAVGTCRYVRVSVGYTLDQFVFFLPAVNMPTYSTTYPVEALGDDGTG